LIVTPDVVAQTTSRVSVTSAGAQSNDDSIEPSISADGRLIAFESLASNLVPGDTNNARDIFVRDRQSGVTSRVSVGAGGAQADAASEWASISSDGRHVAFESFASNLVTGDTNNTYDVFVRDLLTGVTERVSVTSSGAQANGGSFEPSISSDGHYVAFSSAATNLVAGDTNNVRDIFVRDRVAGTTTRVNVATGGAQALGMISTTPAISGDGRRVAFVSFASNLVHGDTNNTGDIFLRDLAAGTTTRVSVDSFGAEADDQSFDPAISADGRFVAFDSLADNLVAGDTQGQLDVFVYEVATGITTRVSVSTSGAPGDDSSAFPSLSADGRWVAFESQASNFVAGDPFGTLNVFLRDRQTGVTTLASTTYSGAQGEGFNVSLSADARFLAFESFATNLVPADTNLAEDVFLHDRQSSVITFCAGDGSLVPCPCGNNGALGHGCDNSLFGVPGALLTGGGVPSLSADSLALTVGSEITGSLRIFLQGDAAIPPVAFGDGLRCVGGTLKRLFVVSDSSIATTVPTLGGPSISSRSSALGDTIPTGATRHYQVYYRDASPSFCPPPAGSTFNISNGVSVTWMQ
jgi:Tol biopolymer transport system component